MSSQLSLNPYPFPRHRARSRSGGLRWTVAVRPDLSDVGFTHFAKQTIGFAASQGVPLASIVVPISGVIAFFGALSIVLGYRARLGAWLIVIFLIGVTPMHKFWGITDPMMQQMQMVMFMKNLAMLGSALLITQFGSGPWSLDTAANNKAAQSGRLAAKRSTDYAAVSAGTGGTNGSS